MLTAVLLLATITSRPYYPVPIAAMASNHHTHVQVSGRVAMIRHEQDGNTHIRLEDSAGHSVVAECIPVLPCPFMPHVGDNITVFGISRFDGEHKWYEVHPVERMSKQ